MSNFVNSIDDINNCLNIVCSINKTPIQLSVFNCGIKFNLGIEKINCCWWIVIRTDGLLDLLFQDNDECDIVYTGKDRELITVLNKFIKA